MGVETVACRVAKCDACGDGWQDNDDYGTPHHPVGDAGTDPDQILAQLLTSDDDDGLGWTRSSEGVLRCKRCSDMHACATLGHDWDSWRSCFCGGRTVHPDGMTSEYRWCDRCGKVEHAVVPGTCEVRPAPVEPSKAAQLVQWRRNHDLFIAAGHSPGDSRVGDEDLPMEVRALIFEAVSLVERIDAAIVADDAAGEQ
jgi:hypothetical protein